MLTARAYIGAGTGVRLTVMTDALKGQTTRDLCSDVGVAQTGSKTRALDRIRTVYPDDGES